MAALLRLSKVTRKGVPIEDYKLRFSVNPGIAYSMFFLGLEACQAAGLDMEKWYEKRYPIELMETVIAWYQAHNLIRAHSEDAAQIKAERERKKNRKK